MSDVSRRAVVRRATAQHSGITRRQAGEVGFDRRRVATALRDGWLGEPVSGVHRKSRQNALDVTRVVGTSWASLGSPDKTRSMSPVWSGLTTTRRRTRRRRSAHLASRANNRADESTGRDDPSSPQSPTRRTHNDPGDSLHRAVVAPGHGPEQGETAGHEGYSVPPGDASFGTSRGLSAGVRRLQQPC